MRMKSVQFPYHIFDSTDELVVEEQMLRLVLGVGSRVEHPARTARHCPKVFLSGVLQGNEMITVTDRKAQMQLRLDNKEL